MTVFYFHLRDGAGEIAAEKGVELEDVTAAKAYATEIGRELLKADEVNKRCCRLDVFDAQETLVLALPLATVDPTLDHLRPELRELIERVCESRRELLETMFRLDGVVSRASGAGPMTRPYLVARHGQRI